MSKQDLVELRGRIDHLNLDILKLINDRTSVIQEIGKLKEKQGVNRYDPVREREMLNVLKQANDGPLPDGILEQVFKSIFTA